MKINSRYYVLIVFSLVSILVTGLAYALIYKKTISQKRNYLTMKEEIKVDELKKESEKNLLKIYSSTDESRAKIATFFVDEEKVIDFIKMVEKVGVDSKTDVELSSISNMEDRIKVQVSAKGSWSNIMTTLKLLENLPISSSINNIRLDLLSNVDKGGKTSYFWEMNLDMEVLIIKETLK